MPRSNVGGWHSHDEIYDIKKFRPLVGDILKYSKDYYRKKGTGRPTKKDRRDIDDYYEFPEQ